MTNPLNPDQALASYGPTNGDSFAKVVAYFESQLPREGDVTIIVRRICRRDDETKMRERGLTPYSAEAMAQPGFPHFLFDVLIASETEK